MLDYIFYRIYTYYNKFKNEGPLISSCFFVFFVLLSLMFFIANILNRFFNGVLSKKSTVFDLTQLKWMYGIFCLILIVSVFIRYGNQKKRTRIFSHFKGSKLNKSIRTWQIFILPILIVVLSIALMLFLKD